MRGKRARDLRQKCRVMAERLGTDWEKAYKVAKRVYKERKRMGVK